MPNSSMAERRRDLEPLSTQLLDQMLQEELQNDEGDPEVVNLILDILKKREKNTQPQISGREKTAWEKYKTRTKGRGDKLTNKKMWILRVASVVLIACILFISMSNEATAKPFWERIAQWTDSVFAFFSPDNPSQRIEEYEFQTDHPGLKQVYDAVTELGVTDPVVPMWLPEGYELFFCQKSDTGKKLTVVAGFQNGEKVINFNVDIYSGDVTNQYQKDDTEAKIFDFHEIKHYVVKNNAMWVAVWTMRNIECSISANCQEDELYTIIRSIYDKEETT